ncbi:MAG TPA: phage tail protein [Ruminiclostridium sp.]|nr:phage tail protein [Ruminiclostridium sp.]
MDYYMGCICLFAFNFAPQGFMLCNGQTLQTNANAALFSLIGKTYGGTGSTTFQLPNLTGASPVSGMQYYICTQGLYPQRQ